MKVSLTTSFLAIFTKCNEALLTGSVKKNNLVGRESLKAKDHHNALSPTDHDASRRLIIHGDEVKGGDYPYLAYLTVWETDKVYHNCGGTLSVRNWILTSASCVGVTGDVNVTAVLGAHNITNLLLESSGGGLIEIHHIMKDDVFVIPDCNDKIFDSDYALLYLSNPSNKTSPKLNENYDLPKVKDTVWVAGWGKTTDSNASDVPMEISLEVVGRDTCDVAYADFGGASTSMLCASGWGKSSVCYGDSGGPLIMKDAQGDILVGVVSFISLAGCNEATRPDVFGRISSAISWIKTQTSK